MSADIDRERLRRAQRDRDQADLTYRSGAITLARVTSSGATLAVGKLLAAIPQVVLGDESEGATAVYEDRGSNPIFVDQLGPGVPATDDKILAHHLPYRWVMRRGEPEGGGGTLFPCLPCDLPQTALTMEMYYWTTSSPSSYGGPISFLLTWTPPGSPGFSGLYQSGEMDVPTDAVIYAPGLKFSYVLSCVEGMNASLAQTVGYPGGSPPYFTSVTEPLISVDFDCDPFFLDLDEAGCCVGFFHAGSISL